MTIKPLDNRIIVRPFPAETLTSFGLVLVQHAAEKPIAGTVVAIGPGRRKDDGTRDPMQVQIGDRIMFGKYAQQPFEHDGQTFLAMCEMDVLFVMEDGP
jgi:chaperonin GroES